MRILTFQASRFGTYSEPYSFVHKEYPYSCSCECSWILYSYHLHASYLLSGAAISLTNPGEKTISEGCVVMVCANFESLLLQRNVSVRLSILQESQGMRKQNSLALRPDNWFLRPFSEN